MAYGPLESKFLEERERTRSGHSRSAAEGGIRASFWMPRPADVTPLSPEPHREPHLGLTALPRVGERRAGWIEASG
jgi:hypothetical protein